MFSEALRARRIPSVAIGSACERHAARERDAVGERAHSAPTRYMGDGARNAERCGERPLGERPLGWSWDSQDYFPSCWTGSLLGG